MPKHVPTVLHRVWMVLFGFALAVPATNISAQGPASGTWQLRASNGALFGQLPVSIVVNPPPP